MEQSNGERDMIGHVIEINRNEIIVLIRNTLMSIRERSACTPRKQKELIERA
jgi:hypothetical protein